MNAALSTFIVFTIESEKFSKSNLSQKIAAVRVPVDVNTSPPPFILSTFSIPQSLIKAIKGRILDISSRIMLTLIDLVVIVCANSSDGTIFILSLTVDVNFITKIDAEAVQALRASHRPLHEHAASLNILGATLLSFLRSMSIRRQGSSNLRLSIHPKHGLLLKEEGHSSARLLIPPEEMTQFTVKRPVAVILYREDLFHFCTLAAKLFATLDLYADSSDCPVVMKISPLDGMDLTCVLTSLPIDEQTVGDQFSNLTQNQLESYASDSELEGSSGEEDGLSLSDNDSLEIPGTPKNDEYY